jgi:hypothetical protein
MIKPVSLAANGVMRAVVALKEKLITKTLNTTFCHFIF